jgi:hypothetical protein
MVVLASTVVVRSTSSTMSATVLVLTSSERRVLCACRSGFRRMLFSHEQAHYVTLECSSTQHFSIDNPNFAVPFAKYHNLL